MRESESTLRSAAPSIDGAEIERASEEEPSATQELVLAGGMLVELDPPQVSHGDLVLRGDTIVQVGGTAPEGPPRVDVSGCIVTPAFTDAHAHAYMALTRGAPTPGPPPRSLLEHLRALWWKVDKALDDDLVHTSALVAAAVAARAGVTCIVDLHSSPRAIDGSLDRVEAALDEIGIRGALAYETTDREGRGRREAAMRENRRFLKKVEARATSHRALVGAHAPMSLNDDTLDALRELADESRAGIHLHVAEDTTDGLDAQRKKMRLEDRLARLGVARPGSIVAQALELPAPLLASLDAAGVTFATSPRSNMRHGARLFVPPASARARVVLGTDGEGGDLLGEARAWALRHDEARDGRAREVGARIVAGQDLRAALFGELPARLAVGGRADLAVLDYDPVTPITPSSLASHVAGGWSSGDVRHTICGGRFVVRDRALVNVDEAGLRARARLAARRLWERIGE